MKINKSCIYCGQNIEFDTYDCRYGASDYPAIIYAKSKKGSCSSGTQGLLFQRTKGDQKGMKKAYFNGFELVIKDFYNSYNFAGVRCRYACCYIPELDITEGILLSEIEIK